MVSPNETLNLKRGRTDGIPGSSFIFKSSRSRLWTMHHLHDDSWRGVWSCGVYRVRMRIVCGCPSRFPIDIAVNCGVGLGFYSHLGLLNVVCDVYAVCAKPTYGVVLSRIWFWPFGLAVVIFIIVIRYLFIVGYVHGLSITQSGGLCMTCVRPRCVTHQSICGAGMRKHVAM